MMMIMSRWHSSNVLFLFWLCFSENDNCCPVCVEEYTPEDSLFQSECCPTVSHMDCMRQYSYNAGTYVLKCPFCQDDKKFVKCMLEFSCIYIPTREPLFEDHDRMTMELDCCYDDCPEPERSVFFESPKL